MDILQTVGQYLSNFYDRINPVSAIFTVRLALMGLIFLTLSYNVIYRRITGGMAQILGIVFFLISSFIAYIVPLEFIKESQHPGSYFVMGVVGILASIALIPYTLTWLPDQQKQISKWLFFGVVLLLAAQLIFGLK